MYNDVPSGRLYNDVPSGRAYALATTGAELATGGLPKAMFKDKCILELVKCY